MCHQVHAQHTPLLLLQACLLTATEPRHQLQKPASAMGGTTAKLCQCCQKRVTLWTQPALSISCRDTLTMLLSERSNCLMTG